MDPINEEQLVARRAELERRYDELKASTAARVLEWRWSYNESGWEDPRPLACERNGTVRGPLDVKGGRSRDNDHVGFDADGRPVFVQRHYAGGVPGREALVLWGASKVESAEFASGLVDGKFQEPELEHLIVVRFDDAGRALDGYVVSGKFVKPERYFYDDRGRLARVEIPWEPLPESVVHATVQVLVPSYGKDGSLVALDQEWEDPMPQGRLWERPADQSVAHPPSRTTGEWKLAPEAQRRVDSLVAREKERVLVALRQHHFPGPVCAVAVLYDDQHPQLPAITYLCALTEARRAAAEQESNDGLLALLWSPPDWDHTDLLGASIDSGVQLSQQVGADLADAGCDLPERVIARELVHQLGREDLTGRVESTDDFAAFAISTELGESGPEAFKSTAPEAIVERYRNRGWLSEPSGW